MCGKWKIDHLFERTAEGFKGAASGSAVSPLALLVDHVAPQQAARALVNGAVGGRAEQDAGSRDGHQDGRHQGWREKRYLG